jgi:hypothetical protein
MECRDVRELADAFLTAQLLVETNHDVVRHLEICPACRAEIDGRRDLRDRLRAAIDRAADLRPRPEFAAELVATLRPRGHLVSRRRLLQSWGALAAGVVLAAGGGVLVRESRARSRLTVLAQAAAGDHQHCAVRFSLAERPITLEDAARRYGAPYAALASLELDAIDPGLETVERHSCVYDGRRFGHVVLRYRGALVSLLVTAGTPPAAPQLEASASRPAVAALPAGRFVGFVVADLEGRQLLRLAGMLSDPLARHFG